MRAVQRPWAATRLVRPPRLILAFLRSRAASARHVAGRREPARARHAPRRGDAMPITIMLTDHAREAAEMYSTPVALEAQARKEIAAVLGWRRLRTFHTRSMRFDIHFAHAGEDFMVMARDACTWEVQTYNCEPVCPPYPIVFSDRATALINGMGWNLQGIEQHARLALRRRCPGGPRVCRIRRTDREHLLQRAAQRAGHRRDRPRRLGQGAPRALTRQRGGSHGPPRGLIECAVNPSTASTSASSASTAAVCSFILATAASAFRTRSTTSAGGVCTTWSRRARASRRLVEVGGGDGHVRPFRRCGFALA